MRFSELVGVSERILQDRSMDARLKNALWHVPHERFWKNYYRVHTRLTRSIGVGMLLRDAWVYNFGLPDHTLLLYFQFSYEQVYKRYEELNWGEVYDFVEYVANYPDLTDEVRKALLA